MWMGILLKKQLRFETETIHWCEGWVIILPINKLQYFGKAASTMQRLPKWYRMHQIPSLKSLKRHTKVTFSMLFPTLGHISAFQKISTSTSFGSNFVA